jgi:hypothetical protein
MRNGKFGIIRNGPFRVHWGIVLTPHMNSAPHLAALPAQIGEVHNPQFGEELDSSASQELRMESGWSQVHQRHHFYEANGEIAG